MNKEIVKFWISKNKKIHCQFDETQIKFSGCNIYYYFEDNDFDKDIVIVTSETVYPNDYRKQIHYSFGDNNYMNEKDFLRRIKLLSFL
jgi:hypothetical protein